MARGHKGVPYGYLPLQHFNDKRVAGCLKISQNSFLLYRGFINNFFLRQDIIGRFHAILNTDALFFCLLVPGVLLSGIEPVNEKPQGVLKENIFVDKPVNLF